MPATSTRRFACSYPQCTKSFTRKSDLERHSAIHDPSRHIPCPWSSCMMTFSSKDGLKAHYNTHTGARPHLCGHMGCPERFGDASCLSRHQKHVHLKIFDICRFAVKGCPYTYKRSDEYRKHLWGVHGCVLKGEPRKKRINVKALLRVKQREEEEKERQQRLEEEEEERGYAVATTTQSTFGSFLGHAYGFQHEVSLQSPPQNQQLWCGQPCLTMDPRSMTGTPEPSFYPSPGLYANSSHRTTPHPVTPDMTPNVALRPTLSLPSPVYYPKHLPVQSHSHDGLFKQTVYDERALYFGSQPGYEQPPAGGFHQELHVPERRHTYDY